MPTREVVVWSDYICPFCRIGQALSAWLVERFDVTVEYQPFFLHADHPEEGVPQSEFVARYGPGLSDRTAALFASRGLEFNPYRDRVPNTLKALRLTEHAREQGLHAAFHGRVMDAFWIEAQNIGSADVLCELAAATGLEGAEEVLAGDAYRDRVVRSTYDAHLMGIDAVPAYLLDRRLLVLGAQPREAFELAFAQLAAA